MGKRAPQLAALIALFAMSIAWGEFSPNQVLVVFNSASADGVTLKDAFRAAHPGIPSSNVLDLNSALLLTADLTPAQFIANVRDPIRNHILAPGAPTPDGISVIVLIRPIPHRVRDSDNAAVGDTPANASNELVAGDATYASVDAELVLLWQDLFSAEAGATMDSRSDNIIDNPYHMSSLGIDFYSHAAIQTAKTFTNISNFYWGLGGAGATRLTPGDMYLVCRIDGNTLADAVALIDRAQGIVVNQSAAKTILDEYNLAVREDLDDDEVFGMNDPFLAGDDFEETRDILAGSGWAVRYDDTSNFITGTEELTPLIAYSSYGENHSIGGAGEDPPGSGAYISGFQFAQGAIFNTYESYNARALNGLPTQFNQEQVTDFVAAGGTFGVGHVYEPFTFTIPDNEFLFVNMLVTRRRWAEAAYASLPVLSWQHVVLGDPFGRYDSVWDSGGDCDADGNADLADYADFAACMTGPSSDVVPGCECADLDADADADLLDFSGFQQFVG